MESLLDQGNEYEEYVAKIIKNTYKNVWLWKCIPKTILMELGFIKDLSSNCDDIGCDIIAQRHDNTYDHIQCKHYSTLGIDNTISISDLAGFYNYVAENNIQSPILYYSGVLSSQIECRMKKIKYTNLPMVKISNEDIKPRDYQIEAFNKLDKVNRGILEMPCGTGKTLVTYLISLNYDNIILISPLIATTDQLMVHYKNYYSQGDSTNDVVFNTIHSDGNRKIENIKFGTKNIIGCTFDSCDIVNKLLDKLTGSIFIIIDECHNLSNAMISDSGNDVYKILSNSKYKILFVSATPKKYEGYDGIENIFGTVKYKLSWDDAIRNKYICESQFYYPNADKIVEYFDDIKFDKTVIEKTKLIYKAFFLLESIKNLDIKKCIVYLKTVREAEHFENILKLVNIYHELKLAVYSINYNTSKTKRNESLTKFRNNKTKISIMLNVHVLDEGIDIPECDSVFLTNPNNNPTNIIQRISRANRIINGVEKIAKVLIWGKNRDKIESVFKNIGNFITVKRGIVNNNKFLNGNNDNDNDNDNNMKNNDLNKTINLDYLKKFSTINNKFIDDFFYLYKYNTKDTEFVIDLEILVTWLGARKSTIKSTLVNSYTKNIDYIETISKDGTTGRPSSKVMITPDCMKRLCMVSRTKKAEEVRTYFIELEKHIDQYKDVIIEKYITNHTPQQKDIKGGVIYILNTDLNLPGVYKIGKTEDFKSRLKTHQSSHVDNIKIVKVYKTTDINNVETCLKQYLKERQFKKYKEFYQIDIDDISKLFKVCNNATLSAKKKIKKNEQKGGYYIYLEKE